MAAQIDLHVKHKRNPLLRHDGIQDVLIDTSNVVKMIADRFGEDVAFSEEQSYGVMLTLQWVAEALDDANERLEAGNKRESKLNRRKVANG